MKFLQSTIGNRPKTQTWIIPQMRRDIVERGGEKKIIYKSFKIYFLNSFVHYLLVRGEFLVLTPNLTVFVTFFSFSLIEIKSCQSFCHKNVFPFLQNFIL